MATATLVLNPFLSAREQPDGSLLLKAARRGGMRIETRFGPGGLSRDWGEAILDRLAAGRVEPTGLPPQALPLLIRQGLALLDTELDSLPGFRVPLAAGVAEGGEPVPLLATGSLCPAPHVSLPWRCVLSGGEPLWHQRPGGPVLPWWPDPACRAALRSLDTQIPTPVPPAVAATLLREGLAVPVGGAGPSVTGGGREALATQGFVLVPGLLPPAHLAAWQAYADALVAAGLTEHSAKAADRDTYHGDPVGTLFLHLFRPAAEALAGRPLVPSYAFLSAYRAASALDEHLDRPPCEYTLSLHIDHRPRPDGPVPWPLRIRPGPDTAPVELRCRLGDGVVFRGRRLPHSRPRLPEGDRSTTLLLHYVHPDYQGPLD